MKNPEDIARQPWYAQAECQRPRYEAQGVTWISDSDQDMHAAQTVCATRCTVRDKCLRWALAAPETGGVWGGLTPRQLELLVEAQRVTWAKAHPDQRRKSAPRLAAA